MGAYTVRLGAVSAAYRARLAGAAEIERYWPALLEAWPAHETYRARSGARHVFVLEPCGRRASGPGAAGPRHIASRP
jgi:hypothetical protein